MKLRRTNLACILAAVTASLPVYAEEGADSAEKGAVWESTAELGFVKTSGNSDTQTLNAKMNTSTAYDLWKHTLQAEALNSTSNDVRSAEKYRLEGQSDYSLSERSYALGLASWENDNFSGFDYQATAAIGLGYKAIQESDMTLSLELAPGYRISEYEVGDTEKDAIIRAAENFSWKFSPTSKFDQYLNTEAGDSNTVTRFGVSLTSQVADALSMKLGYQIKHNSDVTPGADKTDKQTSVTLVYKL